MTSVAIMSSFAPRFTAVLAVEVYKLRRSLALLLAAIAPLLIAVFVFFNLLRLQKPMSWVMALQSSAAIWAYFMLPMSATALTALVAHTEHGPRTWDHLRALPIPRWHLFAGKAVCMIGLMFAMSLWLALVTTMSVAAADWWKTGMAVSGSPEVIAYLILLCRILVAAWLLIALQLWVALRFSSFVPALAVGIGGTFFAVVAPTASIGLISPWHIPVNQLAGDPARAQIALLFGGLGGCLVFALMLWRMNRHEMAS